MIKITKKRSPIFAVKAGMIIVALFALIGLALKVSDVLQPRDSVGKKQDLASLHYSDSNPTLIPTVRVAVGDTTLEKNWVEGLRQEINGRSEVAIENGRIDVVTDAYAIEVDFFRKWQEGLGQALHYGDVSGKIPTLALIDEEETTPDHVDRLKYVESLCIKKGVKLLLLKPIRSK